MAKIKRVYKYGQCYKDPKTFVTYSIEEVYGKGKLTILRVRDMVTRETHDTYATTLDSFEPEYTYSE